MDHFLGEWRAWHDARERRLTAPDGYLAITALHWLDERWQRFDDAPGEWRAADDGAEVALAPEEWLEVGDEKITGRHLFTGLDQRPVRALVGDATLEVAARGGRPMLRPRHPDNPLRRQHAPTPTYPPSPAWVVPARFRPYDVPEPVSIETVVDWLAESVDVVGEVEFEAGDAPQRLVAFSGGDGGELWLLFADATSGDTTYRCRQLAVGAPAPDGSLWLDFNRAHNPPCAYTDFSTCPLPPAANRLQVRIEAGELLPADR